MAGKWKLLHRPTTKDVYVWTEGGAPAVEIIGDSNGWWRMRKGGMEYVVWSGGDLASNNSLYYHPWDETLEKPRGIRRGASFTITGAHGMTRVEFDGKSISVFLIEKNKIVIPVNGTTILYYDFNGKEFSY